MTTLFLVIFLAGCSQEKSPKVSMEAFWSFVGQWSANPKDKEAANKACSFLSENALSAYPGEGERRCLFALESAFSPWAGKKVFRVETVKSGRWIKSGDIKVFIQPLALFVKEGRTRTVKQVESAAVLLPKDDFKIESLAGLAYPILLPDRDLSPSPLDMAILASGG